MCQKTLAKSRNVCCFIDRHRHLELVSIYPATLCRSSIDPMELVDGAGISRRLTLKFQARFTTLVDARLHKAPAYGSSIK
jgi:hypothetical protein